MSLEANPIDVHRATDAALAGIDLLTRKHRNVLLLATTNFPRPSTGAACLAPTGSRISACREPRRARQSSLDVLEQLASHGPMLAELKKHIGGFVAASEGLDGRRLRKAIVSAAASSIETARDLNKLKPRMTYSRL